MEKALFVTEPSRLRSCSVRGYRRLYFGCEFCQRLMPGVAALEKALLWADKARLAFTLVTPYVTQTGYGALERLLGFLSKRGIPAEVVINDWGTLELLRLLPQGFQPVAGRLLTKQKRGPTIIPLLSRQAVTPLVVRDPHRPKSSTIIFQKKLPPAVDPYYKGSNASSVPLIQEFFLSIGIRRMELDNLAQGMHLELLKDRMTASVYTPYVYITTTFFCPSAGCEQKGGPLLKLMPCTRPCRRYGFLLRHRSMPKPLYLRGNTMFYKHAGGCRKAWAAMGISRIVHQPFIPV